MGIALTEQQAWEKLRSGGMLMRHLPWWEEKRASGEYAPGASWYEKKWDVLWLNAEGQFVIESWLTGRKRKVESTEIDPLEGKWEEADFGRFKASNADFLQDALDVLLEKIKEYNKAVCR